MNRRYYTQNELRQEAYYERKDAESGHSMRACMYCMIGLVVFLLLAACFSSCTTTEYVPIVETHDVHHYHTDSIHNTDSVIHEKETLIMQLDSAAMALYGIQLKSAERAWLVKTKELELQIQRLMEISATKDSVHDSIPVPYPVEKLVERELTWWQKTQMYAGDVLLAVIFGLLCFGGWKLFRKISII